MFTVLLVLDRIVVCLDYVYNCYCGWVFGLVVGVFWIGVRHRLAGFCCFTCACFGFGCLFL